MPVRLPNWEDGKLDEGRTAGRALVSQLHEVGGLAFGVAAVRKAGRADTYTAA